MFFLKQDSVLEDFGHGVDKKTLCDHICDGFFLDCLFVVSVIYTPISCITKLCWLLQLHFFLNFTFYQLRILYNHFDHTHFIHNFSQIQSSLSIHLTLCLLFSLIKLNQCCPCIYECMAFDWNLVNLLVTTLLKKINCCFSRNYQLTITLSFSFIF